MKRLQTGDIDYKEESAAAAVRNKIEVDGITAEQNAAAIKVNFQYYSKHIYFVYYIVWIH